MLAAALLFGHLVFAADTAPSPVVAALAEVAGPQKIATLKRPLNLESVAATISTEQKPAAKAALAHIGSNAPQLLPEISRAYYLLGDERAALAAAARSQALRPGSRTEVQHALALARAGDYEAAYAEAVALNEKHPGRSDIASLLAATRGRGRGASNADKTASGPTVPDEQDHATPAIAAMQQAAASRQAGDMDAAWRHVQEAMRIDPASPAVQELYRMAELDRRRHAAPKGPTEIDLSANFPGEPAPRRSGPPLWPMLPVGLAAAGVYAAARRKKTYEAGDEPESMPEFSDDEKFVHGAVLAGIAGMAAYFAIGEALTMTPALTRAINGGGQQVMRVVNSESGAINPQNRTLIQRGPTLSNLNIQLAAQEIAGGHAFGKHAAESGVRTQQQYAELIENVMSNPTMIRNLPGGRIAYWQQSSATVVIRDPHALDGGTAFIPKNGIDYFLTLR